jgi:hypothetical protein
MLFFYTNSRAYLHSFLSLTKGEAFRVADCVADHVADANVVGGELSTVL